MTATVNSQAPSSTLQTDTDAVRTFFERITLPGEVREIRIPKSKRGPARLFKTVSGYVDNPSAAAEALSRLAGTDAEAIYATLNPVHPDAMARAFNRIKSNAETTSNDADVIGRRLLLIDCDPSRLTGISSTDNEMQAALERRDDVRAMLTDQHGWPDPLVVTMSGNGGGLLYRIDEPNDAETTALIGTVLKALAHLFDDDVVGIDTSVANAARLTKIPGTVAAKGDSTDQRPWRMSTAEYPILPDIVSRTMLTAVAAHAPEPVSTRPGANGTHSTNQREWSVDDLLAFNNLQSTEIKVRSYGTTYALDRCLTSDDHTDGAVLTERQSGALSYSCRHNRCQGMGWQHLRDHNLIELPKSTAKLHWDIPPRQEPPPSDKPSHDATEDNQQDDWRSLVETVPLDIDTLPYYLRRLTGHILPYTTMFPADWSLMMSLPFWSSLWPGVKLQNLNLVVWALGVSHQGIGKNVATDELQRIMSGVTGEDMLLYTAGTAEGIWDALAGDGKRMLAYLDEFGGFLKLLRREHMQGARESLSSIYDGRAIGYHRAKKNSVRVTNPHFVMAATTQVSSIRDFVDPQDLTNGFLSRFMICAPDPRATAPDYYPEDGARLNDIVRELRDHTAKYRHIQKAEWLESGRRDPARLNEYREHLGMNSGEQISLDDLESAEAIPAGRLVARVKKIAALLELAEKSPGVRDNKTVLIRPEHVDTAIDIVEHGFGYALRLRSWVGRSSDYELAQKIVGHLKSHGRGLTQRELCRLTHSSANEVKAAIELNQSAGLVEGFKNGKRTEWRLQ